MEDPDFYFARFIANAAREARETLAPTVANAEQLHDQELRRQLNHVITDLGRIESRARTRQSETRAGRGDDA